MDSPWKGSRPNGRRIKIVDPPDRQDAMRIVSNTGTDRGVDIVRPWPMASNRMDLASQTETTPSVGISIAESPDLRVLGLSDGHLRDAMAEIALQLLASGMSLAYGGDLRQHGFTRLLAELVGRYRGHPLHAGTIAVTDYLAWPVHIRMTSNELAAFSADHELAAGLVFLELDGGRLAREERLKLPAHQPREDEWAKGLTAMRTVMLADIRARIVLGGRVEGYRGAMPGIAEETYLSLDAHQPVFVLGGFGGCARDIAETFGLAERWAGSREDWSGRDYFRKYSPDNLHNGLSREENSVLEIGRASWRERV